MSTSDNPYDFFGSIGLSQHIIPTQIEHLRPETATGKPRCDDEGRRRCERLGGPKDILPRAIGHGVVTDHDRRRLDQIDSVAASGANERSPSCFLQDRLKDGPLAVFWSYQENARMCRGERTGGFLHVRASPKPAGAMPFQQAPGKTRASREGKMPAIIRLWLTTSFLLGSLMLISEGVTGTGISLVLGRVTLTVSALGCLLLIMRRWWHKTVGARLETVSQMLSAIETGKDAGEPPVTGKDEISKLADLVHRVCLELNANRGAGRDSSQEAAATSCCRRLSENLRLAVDHVESIRALIEISQTYQQPIPRAAFQNLELVSKHLRKIQRQLDSDQQVTQPEGAFQLR